MTSLLFIDPTDDQKLLLVDVDGEVRPEAIVSFLTTYPDSQGDQIVRTDWVGLCPEQVQMLVDALTDWLAHQ